MKKIRNLILLLTFVFPLFSYSQTMQEKDSLINRMCEDLIKSKNLPDSARIENIYQKHLYPYLSKFDENRIDSLWTNIYYRFQRNCYEFIELLNNIEPVTSDWEILEEGEKPDSMLSKRACKKFTKYNELSYLEANGDTVIVEVKNGFWTDNFLDGTKSKLIFNWTSNCEFELEFIESDNETRRNLSVKGDTYKYEIIEKINGGYILILQMLEQNNYFKFKMYSK